MSELLLQACEDGRVGRFWVVDLRRVAVVEEVSGADEAVAAWNGRGMLDVLAWICRPDGVDTGTVEKNGMRRTGGRRE